MKRVLVLCTGNSARSILLESILNRYGADRLTAFSAGSRPSGSVDAQSLTLLGDLGYDTRIARSKSWDEFARPTAPKMDIVITVCGSAANEVCPIWPGAPVRAHWGVEDPAAAVRADWQAEFQTAYDILLNRAMAFLELPVENMTKADLTSHLNKVGALT